MNAAQLAFMASYDGPPDERYFAELARLATVDGHTADGRVAGRPPRVPDGTIDRPSLAVASPSDGQPAQPMAGPGRGPSPLLSAQTPLPSRAGSTLHFQTAREIAAQVAEQVEWYVPGYLAAGATTELVGKIKAAGKTTFLTYAIGAIVTGEPFLGRATRRTGVVYLTEQPPSSFRVALRRAGLLDRDDVAVLFWRDTAGRRWPELVASAVRECQHRGAGILVVDTLPRFAGLRGDAENNAGDADEAMAPLQIAAADGLAVVVVRHERKAGGEVGDSGRGSSAFGGAVDIVLALKRGDGATRPTVRVLHALSRFDETPPELVVELTEEGYVALGDETAVARAEARARVVESLPTDQTAALTFEELHTRLPGASRSTIQRVLDELIAAGKATRSGAGRRGSPYRFSRGASADLLAAQLPEAVGQQETLAQRSDDPQAEGWIGTAPAEPQGTEVTTWTA